MRNLHRKIEKNIYKILIWGGSILSITSLISMSSTVEWPFFIALCSTLLLNLLWLVSKIADENIRRRN